MCVSACLNWHLSAFFHSLSMCLFEIWFTLVMATSHFALLLQLGGECVCVFVCWHHLPARAIWLNRVYGSLHVLRRCLIWWIFLFFNHISTPSVIGGVFFHWVFPIQYGYLILDLTWIFFVIYIILLCCLSTVPTFMLTCEVSLIYWMYDSSQTINKCHFIFMCIILVRKSSY